MASLLKYIDLFKNAPTDDLARAALPAAREELLPPPAPRIKLSSGEEITPFDTKLGERNEALEGDSPTAAGSAAEISRVSGLGMSPGQPIGGGGIGGWMNRHPLLSQLGIGLAGAGIGRLLGGASGGTKFFEGYGGEMIQGIHQQQQEALARRQQAWEDAYKEVGQLPATVYDDPRFKELADAANALRADLGAGKTDNEKSIAAFLMAKSKYRKDLEMAQAEQEYAMQKQIEDRKAQDALARNEQVAQSKYQILQQEAQTPGAFPPDVVAEARNFIAQHEQVKRSQELAAQRTQAEETRWKTQQGWHDEQTARENTRLGLERQRLELAQGAAGQKGQAAGIKGAVSAIDRDIRMRLKTRASEAAKAAAASLDPNPQPFDINAAKAEAILANEASIVAATGLALSPPDYVSRTPHWKARIMGQEVPLPFDPRGPGRVKLLSFALDRMYQAGSTPEQPELSLSGAYSPENF